MSVGRSGFVRRHELFGEEEWRGAREVLDRCRVEGLELVRVAFADQHGMLRCKAIPAGELASVFENGIAVPISILAKDTADRTVFPVFTREAMFGVTETRGAGDLILVPDPSTFRVLPWAGKVGWILCDLFFPSGDAVPFSARGVYRRALERLARSGYEYRVGLELECHVFILEDRKLRVEETGWPAPAPQVRLLTHGFRLLGESRWDECEVHLEELRRSLEGAGIRLRSMELEFGPSQVEVTFDVMPGLEAADTVVLFRATAKQVLRRRGLWATFMARPLASLFSSGWHLHQSLAERETGENAFMGRAEDEFLSPVGRSFLAGLLRHARAASVFACPTINGYKRYRPLSLAPDRVCWAIDNKGAMVRVVTAGPYDPATRLENRAGEPAANPYLYMAAQLIAGMDGVRNGWEPGPPVEEPYSAEAPALPRSLEEAVEELSRSEVFRREMGELFVEYVLALKRAEIRRFQDEVTEWEQREYGDMF